MRGEVSTVLGFEGLTVFLMFLGRKHVTRLIVSGFRKSSPWNRNKVADNEIGARNSAGLLHAFSDGGFDRGEVFSL